MTPMRFKIGDRVTARYPQQLPVGPVGTVVHVYAAAQEGYDVEFDDHRLALLWVSELDRAVDAPRVDRRRKTVAN
jgi:hypothetical protein